MKRIFALLLSIMLIFALASCENDNTDNKLKSHDTPTSTSQLEVTQQDQSSNSKVDSVELSYSFKVPGKNIFVDVPNYQEIERGFTELFILNGERYIAITFDKLSNVETLQEAHDKAFSIFVESIQDYSYVNSIDIKNDSITKVNDIDVYKYVGTLNCALDYSNRDNSYDAFVIGYSFIMDGIPCTITGSIINRNQPENDIQDLTNIVDSMIQTLRSER